MWSCCKLQNPHSHLPDDFVVEVAMKFHRKGDGGCSRAWDWWQGAVLSARWNCGSWVLDWSLTPLWTLQILHQTRQWEFPSKWALLNWENHGNHGKSSIFWGIVHYHLWWPEGIVGELIKVGIPAANGWSFSRNWKVTRGFYFRPMYIYIYVYIILLLYIYMYTYTSKIM